MPAAPAITARIDELIAPDVRALIAREIDEAGGREVFFIAQTQPDGCSVKHRGARSANVGRARPSARVEAARCGALRLFRWSAGP